jgi:hypothetical protein
MWYSKVDRLADNVNNFCGCSVRVVPFRRPVKYAELKSAVIQSYDECQKYGHFNIKSYFCECTLATLGKYYIYEK